MVEWETGEITEEALSLIAADDPVTCAIYAKKHDPSTWMAGKGSNTLLRTESS